MYALDAMERSVNELQFAESTKKIYLYHLYHAADFWGCTATLQDITENDVARLYAQLMQYHPISYVQRYQESVGLFFNWAMSSGYISTNPACFAPLPDDRAAVSIPSEFELEQILWLMKEDARDYAIIRLIADTAAPISRLMTLQIPDIDLSYKSCVFNVKYRNHSRPCYASFSKQTGKALAYWLARRGLNVLHDRVFCLRHAPFAPIENPYTINVKIATAAKKAGIKAYRLNEIRLYKLNTVYQLADMGQGEGQP